MTTAAVVLAAGAGSRFAGAEHKLLTLVRGEPLVARSVGSAVDAGLDETIVVAGAVDLRDALGPSLAHVTLLVNDRWADGMATSLALAVDHAAAAGHDAVVVGLGDQPGVEPDAWRALAAAPYAIAIATYGGKRRNPVRLGRDVWPLLDRTGDEGARALARRRPDLVGEVACRGVAADVDTVEDLAKWS